MKFLKKHKYTLTLLIISVTFLILITYKVFDVKILLVSEMILFFMYSVYLALKMGKYEDIIMDIDVRNVCIDQKFQDLYNELKYIRKKISEKDPRLVHNTIDSNLQKINQMSNVKFLEFIKERFNLPDYCKMCDNYRPRPESNVCMFKGLDGTCKDGFEKWLSSSNELEGDMDADIY